MTERAALTVRRAEADDLDAIAALIDEHVRGHPAEHHVRNRNRLKSAYFGSRPVAHLFIAHRAGTLLGMGQWTPIFDMFWGKLGGQGEWLYVTPEARGSGIAAAIVAAICADLLRSGGEFLRFNADDDRIGQLYQRVATGGPPDWFYLAASALPAFAALDGLSPREIVRRLPDPSLNHIE